MLNSVKNKVSGTFKKISDSKTEQLKSMPSLFTIGDKYRLVLYINNRNTALGSRTESYTSETQDDQSGYFVFRAPEEFKVSVRSDFETLSEYMNLDKLFLTLDSFAGLGVFGSANNIAKTTLHTKNLWNIFEGKGVRTLNIFDNYQIWKKTSPLTFDLTIPLVAKYNSKIEILNRIEVLAKLIMPNSADSVNDNFILENLGKEFLQWGRSEITKRTGINESDGAFIKFAKSAGNNVADVLSILETQLTGQTVSVPFWATSNVIHSNQNKFRQNIGGKKKPHTTTDLGQPEKSELGFKIGNYFKIGSLICKGMSVDIDNSKLDPNGYPMAAKIMLTLETVRPVTAAELVSFFNF